MKLFGILSRYTSRSFLMSFGVTLLCLLFIIVLFDFAELQRRLGSKDIGFGLKLNIVFLRAPHFLEQVLPFLVFASALFTFWRMNRTNEMVVMRSIGLSLWRIVLPLSLTAILIGCLDLTAFNPLSNAMYSRYEKLEKRHLSKKKEEIKIASTGLWLSEKRGENQAIYRASKIDLKNLEFKNFNMIIFSPENTFLERIDAKSASIEGRDLVLKNGWIIDVAKTPISFAEKRIKTTLDRAMIEKMKLTRGTYSFWQLPSYIHLLDSSGLDSLKYRMYWHSMLAGAFWTGAMVLLAAAFSCRPIRKGKSVLFLLMGVIIGFTLYFFKDMTFAMGSSGGLPPIIAAWISPLITVMVGATLVFNQEDG